MIRGSLAAAVLATMLTAGCASGTPPVDSPVVPVPQVAQSSPSATEADEASEAATKYFTALASNDPDTMEAGLEHAAPGSIAAAYLKHQATAEGAILDNGEVDEPYDLTSEDGSWGYCPDDVEAESPKCTKWADAKYSAGKLSEFTVNGVDISKRITLGSGDKVKVDSLAEVTFISSYQTITTKSVVVTFEMKAKKNLTMNYDGAKYRGPDGRQSTATDAAGPSDLDKDSTARGYVAFKGAKPGGVVTLDFYDSEYDDHYVKIKTS